MWVVHIKRHWADLNSVSVVGRILKQTIVWIKYLTGQKKKEFPRWSTIVQAKEEDKGENFKERVAFERSRGERSTLKSNSWFFYPNVPLDWSGKPMSASRPIKFKVWTIATCLPALCPRVRQFVCLCLVFSGSLWKALHCNWLLWLLCFGCVTLWFKHDALRSDFMKSRRCISTLLYCLSA